MAIDIDLYRTGSRLDGSSPLGGGVLLDSQSFESVQPWSNISESHSGQTRFARTATSPFSGTHSLRMNLNDSITDPITGLLGSGLYTANFYPDLSQSSFTQQSWIARFRFDDCLWSSGSTGTEIGAKLLYLMNSDPNDLGNTFYLAGGMGGVDGLLNMADNGGANLSGWHTEPYGWGAQVSYGQSGQEWGTDGLWHKLQVDIDYVNGGASNSRLRVLIDDLPITSTRSDAQGWLQIPPRTGTPYSFEMRGWRLGFGGDTTGAVDRTGYANGLQWDDFAVYDNLVEAG